METSKACGLELRLVAIDVSFVAMSFRLVTIISRFVATRGFHDSESTGYTLGMDFPQHLTDAEIRKLLSVIDDPRDSAVIVLVLSTGVFLSELIELNLDSVDLEKKKVSIDGKRKRTLDLTDPAVSSVSEYLKIRPKTPEVALFVTERGVPKRLSERSVDHIIRSAAKDADLDVNYHAIRNTAIVRLLKKTDPKTAAKLLGVERDALDRFADHSAQQSSPQPHTATESDPMDTRSSLKKIVDIIHPTTQQVLPQKPVQSMTSFCIIGRDKTLCEATEAVQNNQSILLTGPAGVGKSQVLKALADTFSDSILIKSPVPFKPMLLEISKAICPDSAFTQRTPNAEILEAIFSADTLVPPVILIDNLDRLKVSEEEIMMSLTDKFPVVATAGGKPDRLKSLWWKFQELPIEPLDPDTTKRLILQLTQKHSMNPDEYTMLETKVLNLANGNPFAVVELISQLPGSEKVTADHIRQIDHEAGIVYRDWTWIFMVLWGLLVISRFVALGTHSFEGYILAGIGTTVFLTFKTLARMKR